MSRYSRTMLRCTLVTPRRRLGEDAKVVGFAAIVVAALMAPAVRFKR